MKFKGVVPKTSQYVWFSSKQTKNMHLINTKNGMDNVYENSLLPNHVINRMLQAGQPPQHITHVSKINVFWDAPKRAYGLAVHFRVVT